MILSFESITQVPSKIGVTVEFYIDGIGSFNWIDKCIRINPVYSPKDYPRERIFLHELAHATGIVAGRKPTRVQDWENYATSLEYREEEVIAEMVADALGQILGLDFSAYSKQYVDYFDTPELDLEYIKTETRNALAIIIQNAKERGVYAR